VGRKAFLIFTLKMEAKCTYETSTTLPTSTQSRWSNKSYGEKEIAEKYVRFEVSTVVTMKNDVFWVVTPCGSCKNDVSEELSASIRVTRIG
jgi:hypothetical protein